jgi:uncharacterized protein (DUF362 family)
MVVPDCALAATPVDAVRATLDFLREKGIERFIIGEGTGTINPDTMGSFERYGYLALGDSYNVEFRDLNRDDFVRFEGLDANLKPAPLRLARTYTESFVVSVARMKTHVHAVVTLSIKNTAISCILNPDRNAPSWHETVSGKLSHEARPLNLTVARIAMELMPGLAVIDGVVGMEGNGPTNGSPVSSGIVTASADALAADTVAAELMGFDPRTVGYLWYLSQIRGLRREAIQVVGEDPVACQRGFKPCEPFQKILSWYVENWRAFLEGEHLDPALQSSTAAPSPDKEGTY